MPHNIVSFWRNKQPADKRTEDAMLIVLGDRTGGADPAVEAGEEVEGHGLISGIPLFRR